jgi:hypothetical protein
VTDIPAYGVLTKRRVAIWIVGLLVLVAALSIPIGFAAATGKASFSWHVASIFGTAVGTTALAGFTGALAFTTSGDVRATWELATLTRADQETRERPTVILHHAGWSQQREDPVSGQDRPSQTGVLDIRLFNVGLGPALRVEVTAHYTGDDRPEITPVTIPVILPGDLARVETLVFFQRKPDQIKQDGFKVSGTYLDRGQRHEYEIISEWAKNGAASG